MKAGRGSRDPVVAYKEWAPVVARLGAGRQHVLMRKGGIAEGPGGFRPEHEWFWFFPTRFHAEGSKLKPEVEVGVEMPEGLVWAGEVVVGRWLEDWGQVAALEGWHGWAEEEVRRRFEFGKRRGIYALVVRVWEAEPKAPMPQGEAVKGCRSWVPVAAEGEVERRWVPVVGEAEFEEVVEELRKALG